MPHDEEFMKTSLEKKTSLLKLIIRNL
jgi:hypothetical protein